MSSIKPDIEIARAAKIHPIKNVLAKLNVPDGPETYMPIGRYIAKINLEYIHKLNEKNSNLILEINFPKVSFHIHKKDR